jgi:hypothetical protein
MYESGGFWRSTITDILTRLRVARWIAKTETEASEIVFRTLKRRGHPDAPSTDSDVWVGIDDDKMVEVYDQIPEYSSRGQSLTRKQPQPSWLNQQVIEQRDK